MRHRGHLIVTASLCFGDGDGRWGVANHDCEDHGGSDAAYTTGDNDDEHDSTSDISLKDELSYAVGDVLYIVYDDPDGDYIVAKNGGAIGVMPRNHIDISTNIPATPSSNSMHIVTSDDLLSGTFAKLSGKIVKSYAQRYVVLRGGSLIYYNSKSGMYILR